MKKPISSLVLDGDDEPCEIGDDDDDDDDDDDVGNEEAATDLPIFCIWFPLFEDNDDVECSLADDINELRWLRPNDRLVPIPTLVKSCTWLGGDK